MRQQVQFLGDMSSGGALNEHDFRRGLQVCTEPGALSEVQQYEALQGMTYWGLAGDRPELALEAYNAYVLHGWAWQLGVNSDRRKSIQGRSDEYDEARYIHQLETEEETDSIKHFTWWDLNQHGLDERLSHESEREGEKFRNAVVPSIVRGLLRAGKLDTTHEFLLQRRAAHGFRGYPRELEFEQAVDIHVWTAQKLVDPQDESRFSKDREAAFVDLANFALEHAQFPQFGEYQVVPRLAPIRNAMIQRGLVDPWGVFTAGLQDLVTRFNEGFGIDFALDGVRRYMRATRDHELPDIRTLVQWPKPIIEAFNMLEMNPSMPSALAGIIPQAEAGAMAPSASDNFLSDPVLGSAILRGAAGDEKARAEVERLMAGHNGELLSPPPTLGEVLASVTKY